MAVPVVMPKLGNTVESSIIVAWRKNTGERVEQGEILCEIETDKAMIEVESPASGVLLDTFFQVGDDVPVMTSIAAIGEPGENIESLRPGASPHQSLPQSATLNGSISSSAIESPATEAHPIRTPASTSAISPRARKLALLNGVNTTNLSGTGPGGRIIERDIIAAPRLTPLARSMVEKGDFVAPPQGSGAGGRITTKDLQPVAIPRSADDMVQTIPVRGVRKRIAERMVASLQTTAQITLNASADARALLDYRKRLKTSPETLGLQGITLHHLILFAVSRTLLKYPELNTLFLGDSLAQYKLVDLGFAVDTPRGLIVPVIRSADQLSLKQLADRADQLAKACVGGNILPEDLQGGTFTVSNLGSFGIESFTPVLNPPQVGILGVGNINFKPIEVDGEVAFIPHLGLSLTVDHQAVDGAPAARFLQALCQNLAQLDMLLAL